MKVFVGVSAMTSATVVARCGNMKNGRRGGVVDVSRNKWRERDIALLALTLNVSRQKKEMETGVD